MVDQGHAGFLVSTVWGENKDVYAYRFMERQCLGGPSSVSWFGLYAFGVQAWGLSIFNFASTPWCKKRSDLPSVDDEVLTATLSDSSHKVPRKLRRIEIVRSQTSDLWEAMRQSIRTCSNYSARWRNHSTTSIPAISQKHPNSAPHLERRGGNEVRQGKLARSWGLGH